MGGIYALPFIGGATIVFLLWKASRAHHRPAGVPPRLEHAGSRLQDEDQGRGTIRADRERRLGLRRDDLQPGKPDGMVFLVPAQDFQQFFLLFARNDLRKNADEMNADRPVFAELQGLRA